MTRLIAIASISLLMAAAWTTARAQESGDVAAGRHLAETWCSDCHVVSSTQQRGTSYGAPTFQAIAQMKSTTMMSIEAFLQTSHDRMLDLRLSRDQIDDVAAYILSLRHR